MNLPELVISYKRKSQRFRLVLVLLAGLILPLLWGWVNLDIAAIESSREEAQVKRENADRQLKKLIEQKKNAPRLEEQLKFTEGELATAQKRLPDDYFLDQMIQKVGLSARNAKVTLKMFTPGQESVVGGEVQYVELPITISLIGTYNAIAQFADSIVHYDTMLNLRNLNLRATKQEVDSASRARLAAAANTQASEPDLATKFEEEVKTKRVEATMELVLFRSLRNGEHLPGMKGADPSLSGVPPQNPGAPPPPQPGSPPQPGNPPANKGDF
jgi:type IV pilus assembly protein PilO